MGPQHERDDFEPARKPNTGARVALGAIVLVAAAMRLWRIDASGYGTEYYTAGVRSMMDSLHNLFFNAFDPAGFISLDKPPLAFWIQVASAKLFGFSGLSVVLPQVAEGLVAVLLLHHLVARRFGWSAGLLAALFLALTPLSVAVDRTSNTESCLVMVLLLAASALAVAIERGSPWRLALAMALVGVGFNVKMLAAFVVLPGFALAYLLAAPISWPRRAAHLAVGAVVLLAVSLSWPVAYDLTPPESRPYAGSTRGNSMLELAVMQYGVERLAGRDRAVSARRAMPTPTWYAARYVPPGPLRLADSRLAGQVAWLLPFAVLGAFAAWRVLPRGRLVPALALWGGWAGACAIVFSIAAGVFHTHYLVTLAPPLAALAAIGLVALWRARQRGAGWLLAVALVSTAAWQGWLECGFVDWPEEPGRGAELLALAARLPSDWRLWLYLVLIGGTLGAVIPLAAGRATPTAIGIALAALLATPTAWALSTVLAPGDVWFPAANPELLSTDRPPPVGRARRLADSPETRALVEFLLANRRDERFLAATLTAVQAAPIIIRTGAPVMALGGYMGSDPILTPDDFAHVVESGQVRFALIGTVVGSNVGTARGRTRGKPSVARLLVAWIRAHGIPVERALWLGTEDNLGAAPREPISGGRLELYDLRPQAGAIRAATG